MELWDILDSSGNKTGQTIERGKIMAQGQHHLVVDVWIINSNNEFLISKRSSNKKLSPNMWEPTCGCATIGDDSLTAALREVKEEVGIDLYPDNGRFLKRFKLPNRPEIIDVWLFNQDVDIHSVVLQEEETDDAMWATMDMILQMVADGTFTGNHRFPYIAELI